MGNRSNKFDWEEKLISLYYSALEEYIEEISISPKLKEDLEFEELDNNDLLILAEFLATLTKVFLKQQGWLRNIEEDQWNFLFPPSQYLQ